MRSTTKSEDAPQTLTERIYSELREGLRKGVKYEQIRVKFDRDKGPFYNALETVFTDTGAEIESLASERDKIAGQVEKAKSELERIDNENEARERRATELEGRVSELEQMGESTQQKNEKLEREIESKAQLLEKAENIEKLGFTVKKLEKLDGKISEICAKRGIEPKESLDVFFRDLDSYDAKRGWELKLEQLETLIKTKSSEAERWKAESKKLELRYADRKAVVDVVEDLMKQGVGAERILAWDLILDAAGKKPDEFERELEHYGEVEKILRAKLKEIESCEAKISELKSKVETLEKNKARIDFSIKALTISGIMEIENMHEKAKGEFASLMEEVRRWGEIKAEAGKLEDELKIARYFAVKDPIMIKLLPKGAIIFLLGKVILWCELWGINPEVRVPEGLSKKYSGISSYAEVGLADLLRWAYDGMLKVEVGK